MTEIGKMIRDEGIKEGVMQGKADILIKQLIKKFKVVPDEYKEKIKKLPEETVDVMATDIFELEKIDDLENYFN